MKKIINAKNYRLTNSLHLQFVLLVLGLIRKFDLIMSKIADVVNVFSDCIDKEEQCYKIIEKSNLSYLKTESNNARGSLIIGIKHAIKSGLRHFDKAIREAAQRLKIVFDTYDKPISITSMSLDAATVAINNLLKDLKGKYAADVQKLGLGPWVTELQNRNDEFDNFVKSYIEESAEKPAFHSEEVRKETDKAYKDVITCIDALVLLDKETSYDQFISELNTLIKHYNDLLAQHLGRLEAEKEKEKKKENEKENENKEEKENENENEQSNEN